MIARHTYNGFGTGAVKIAPDPRDRQMHHLRRVAAVCAAAPLPPSDERLLPQIKGTYNQGAIPACTTFASATMKSIQDQQEHGAWATYEALEAYHECGGNDREGIDPRKVVQFLKEKGLRVQGDAGRRRIGSYAFAPRDSVELFVTTLKAAIVAGQPFLIQCRLPLEFGWNSSGPRTEAYHELTGVAYDPIWLVVKNTWGESQGKGGLFRLGWDFLTADGFQSGDCAAYTVIDALDDALPPAPAPVIATLPPVLPLTATGILGHRGPVPQVYSGAQIQIIGGDFSIGVIQAFHCGHALEIVEKSAHLLTVKLPRVLGPCVGAVCVQREAVKVVGPLLVVRPRE